jgi:hypothetical protein
MAMLTVPVLIFVRIGLRGVSWRRKPAAGKRRRRRAAARAPRAVRQPALLDDLHL